MDLHPLLVHFPIALVTLGTFTAWVARFSESWASLKETSWFMIWVAAVMAVPTTISGLIAHVPYEETALHSVIETHQLAAFAGTFILGIVALWRWRSRRNGNDVGEGWPYLIVITAIFGLYAFIGLTGGDLVFEYAINVNGVNPLLP